MLPRRRCLLIALYALVAWLGTAHAGPPPLVLPFQPPSEVPLPVRAGIVTTKATLEAKDCRSAGPEALAALQAEAEAAGLPHVVRLLAAADERDLDLRAECRERHAGKEVVGTSMELVALAVAGADEEGWPTLSGDRASHLMWSLSDLSGKPVDEIAITTLGGYPVLLHATHEADLGETALDLPGRAAWAVTEHVLSSIPDWHPVLSPFPELAGAMVVIEVRSRNPQDTREKRRERFRVAISTAAAAAYMRGSLTDQQLVEGATIYYRPSPKTDVEVALRVDAGAADVGAGPAILGKDRQLDVDEDDLEGLVDE